MKNNKGITLVSLVITIIVLLILAGVTIASLSGDNGILTRGKQAKLDDQESQVKEMITLAANEAIQEYYAITYAGATSSSITGDTSNIKSAQAAVTTAIAKLIDSNGKIAGVSVTDNKDNTFTIKFDKGQQMATVSDKGTVSYT